MAKIDEPAATARIFPVVAAALIDHSGLVLVQCRPPDKAMAGLWEFPGGKIEPGETPEMALVRELDEELGIHVEPGDLQAAAFASAPLAERQLLLLLYICRTWGGVPTALDATDIRWVRPDELSMLAMPPADTPLIALLHKLL